MLLSEDVVASITRRNQLDLEAISEIYRGSQSITWLSEQVRFLTRLDTALEEYMSKSSSPIGPLHPFRTQRKVVVSLKSDVERKLLHLQRKNARRAEKTRLRNNANRDIAEIMRHVVGAGKPTRTAKVLSDISMLTDKLGGYDPLASPEVRAQQLAALPKASDGN